MKHYVLDARTATNHFPGIGRYVSQLAKALVEQLKEDEQLVLLRDLTQPSRWQLPPSSSNIKSIETSISPFSLSQQWQLSSLLQKHQVDVYHSPYYLMPYGLKTATIVTIHDLTPQLFPQYVPGLARIVFKLATKLALWRSTHIVTVSEHTKQDLLQHYHLPLQRATAIHHAPDRSFQPQPIQKIVQLRKKYALSANYMLYFGINKPHKNLTRLIRAWHLLSSEQKTGDVLLVIAGAWDKRYPEVKAEVSCLNLGEYIRFLGPISNTDLPTLYAGATGFVFPSLYEGFGLPVIEAMACGTAVACSNTSSLPEVGGDAALYFDPNNVEEMAQQIGRLLTDQSLRENLAQRGLAQARRFAWQKTAAQTLSLYRSIG